MPHSDFRRPRQFILLVAASLAGCGLVVLALPGARGMFRRHLLAFFDAVQGMHDWGPVLVGAAFIPACLFFLPGSPLTLFGGFAFGGTLAGLARVTAAVSIGSTFGATLAFLAGRYVARDWIARRLASRPRFQAIDGAVAKAGFRIVLLTRLSPVFPFNLLNYGLGLTGVSLRDYILGSWIGMLPGTIVYVYLGSTMRQLADVVSGRVEQSPAQRALFAAGLAATLIVAVLLGRIARKAVRNAGL